MHLGSEALHISVNSKNSLPSKTKDVPLLPLFPAQLALTSLVLMGSKLVFWTVMIMNYHHYQQCSKTVIYSYLFIESTAQHAQHFHKTTQV